MRKSSLQLMITLLVALVAGPAFADAAPSAASRCPNGTMKLLVAPFWNTGKAKSSLAAYSFGLSNIVSEAFEHDPCIVPVNGPLILTEELAKLYTPQGVIKDWDARDAYARSLGATHVLTGEFSGNTEKFMLSARLHDITDGNEMSRVGAKTVHDLNLTEEFVNTAGRKYRDVSMRRIQSTLADCVRGAFEHFMAGNGEGVYPQNGKTYRIPRPTEETLKEIASPVTTQGYAFLKLSRAYARYFAIDLPAKRQFDALKTWQAKAKYLAQRRKWMANGGERFTALGLAGTAVNVDPKYAAAQRFEAFLLEQADKPTSARLHYEAAIESRPGDARSLMALGRIELKLDNAKQAKRYFAQAADARPGDAEPRYMLGMACNALRDPNSAVTAFEKARDLKSDYPAARNELAALYSEAERYEDAAREYGEIVRQHGDDKAAAFAHAASLRAAGRLNGAERRLADYAETFRDDPRFHRFRGDVLTMLRRTNDARMSYIQASGASKSERRASDLAAERPTKLLGGQALLDAIKEYRDTGAILDDRSLKYSEAISDAIIDLDRSGAEGCKDGRGASSALLALNLRREFDGYAVKFLDLNDRIAAALRNGEGEFLTLRERGIKPAETVKRGYRQEVAEMDAAYSRNFLPLYRRYKCAGYDGEIHAATVAEVYEHNRARTAKPSAPVWLPKPMPFSPRIVPTAGRIIRFVVDNTRGDEDAKVLLDGEPLGTVAKGAKATFNARAGVHRICVVQPGSDCQDDGAEHTDYLREGWTIRIR